ncbi:MAG: 2-dehydropantoate 2-reductase [Candidatus Lambdaproteobacteria bacterium]|nr:2-dehydropantoate 2-reductase [Candidatus Lambdaproteobacteria bacterium]
MKIAIMGAGAIGGYFGARLAAGGQDVTFIARGPHLEAMRRDGLRVYSPRGDLHLHPVRAVGSPAEAGPAELVLMCVKAYDLPDAARSLAPPLDEDTAVLPLLNGIDIAQRIGAVVGMERLLGGACQISAAIEAPGVIRQPIEMESITFGELDGRITPRAQAIAEALRAAGIPTELSPAIDVALWSKFIFLAPAAGVCCVTGQTLGPVVRDPDTRALLLQSMQEIEALARAKAVALPVDIVARTLAFLDSRPPDVKMSMLWDMEHGRRMELDVLNGAAADLGEALGVPVPANRFIATALKHRAQGAPRPSA